MNSMVRKAWQSMDLKENNADRIFYHLFFGRGLMIRVLSCEKTTLLLANFLGLAITSRVFIQPVRE